ncbi:hypothetical protein MRB53_038142 [Persea americana]|nr:hypothetical protein MRB53_038142 [Persea americana]
MRVYRGLSITLVDALLGWAIWLQATVEPFTPPPRHLHRNAHCRAHTLQLTNILTRLRALSVLRNGVARSEPLRAVADDYWRREDDEMRSVLEDPEVVAAIRTALAPPADGTSVKPRVDLERVERDASDFVDRVVLGASAGAGLDHHARCANVVASSEASKADDVGRDMSV